MTRSRLFLLGGLWLGAAAVVIALFGACSPRSLEGSADRSRGYAAFSSQSKESGDQQQLTFADLTESLKGHVGYLASDALSGRLIDTEGIALAEHYIAGTFRRFGLSPLPGQEEFNLDFDLYQWGIDDEKTILAAQIGERTLVGVPGENFRPFPFSAVGMVHSEVIFAGYGITAPEYDYDDYEGLEVEGKLVLVFRHEPQSGSGEQYFQGAELTDHSLFLTKARNALQHGAVGLLLVTGPASYTGPEDFRLQPRLSLQPTTSRSYGVERQDILALHVSQTFAAALIEPSGMSLEELQESLEAGKNPEDLAIGDVTARMSVETLDRGEKISARNLAGFIQGSDPELRDEWIIIGAHHDHLGRFAGEGDTIFNGADDNASGVAGVLSLAGVLSAADPPPRRSVVFVTFSAEEQGLLGSRIFTREQIALERVVLMINLDMIGRNPQDPVQIMGDGYTPGLREIVENVNREIGLALRFGGVQYSPASDHDPFFQEGIPFLFFFTGIHPDYHGREDHSEKLAYARMASIVKLVQGIVLDIARNDIAFGSSISVWWLGLTVQMQEQEGRWTATIMTVEEGSQAQKNGFQKGDRITDLDGVPIKGPRDLRRQLYSLEPEQVLAVRLVRDGRELVVSFRRAPAGYLGVMIERLEEDLLKQNELQSDEGVMVSRVLPGGPAQRAGLRKGDVIIAIANQPVNVANLDDMLAQIGANNPVELILLRQAERITVNLTLGVRP